MSADERSIGTDKKQKAPRLVIVDGQQRLTSLYAVIKGVAVYRENYESEYIQIAFNPLEEEFKVSDAAVQKDPTYIPDISKLWYKNTDFFVFVEDYLDRLSKSREVSSEEEKK